MASYSQIRLQQLTGSLADLAYSGSRDSAASSATGLDEDLGAVLGRFAGAIGRISGKSGVGTSGFTNQAAGVFTHASTKFGSGGDEFEILESSDDVTLSNLKQDKDIIFSVNDGGSPTEVMRLDGDVSALKVATGKQVQFGLAARNITDSGNDLVISSGADLDLTATADVNIPSSVGLTFGDDGEKIEGDGTDLTVASSAKINLAATSDVHVPVSVGIVFDGNGSEKIESDDTDLTVSSGAKINLTATSDVVLPASVGLILDGAGAEKIESDGTDINIAVGADGDVNLPANIGLTFGNDGEKIEGDGTDLTIAGNNINLTAVADVVVPANVGVTFGSGEKIEGDDTDLTVTSGAKINLAATSDVHVPASVGIVLDSNGSEKIESDDTDLTVTSGAKINLTATSDVHLPSDVGMVFGDAGEKIEGDGTKMVIASSEDIDLTATADVNLPQNVGLTFGDDGEKIEGNGSRMLIESSAQLILDAETSMDFDANGGIFNFLDNTALGLKLDLATSAGDAIFKDTGDTEIFRIDSSADSLLMDTVRPLQFRDADLSISSPSATVLKMEAIAKNVSVEGAGVQLSGSTGVGLSGSLAISADGGMTSAGGAQAGKMLFGRYSEFATFRDKDLFSASTSVIGALNALADAASGGVVVAGRLSAAILANADVTINDSILGSPESGFAAALNSENVEPANTEVYVNGQLMLSGNSAAGSNVSGGDYIIKSYADPAVLKFGFDLEMDDVIFVKSSATQ